MYPFYTPSNETNQEAQVYKLVHHKDCFKKSAQKVSIFNNPIKKDKGTHSIHGNKGSSPSYSSMASIKFLIHKNSTKLNKNRAIGLKPKSKVVKLKAIPSFLDEILPQLVVGVRFESVVENTNIATSLQWPDVLLEKLPLVTSLLLRVQKV